MSNKSRFIVGLTGGIGSGKSTIATMFSDLGIDVIDADAVSRSVLDIYPELLQKIFKYFGSEIKNIDGSLNRKALGKIVFGNKDKLKYLEQILHPKIREQILKKVQSSSSIYTMIMVPLLFEKNLDVLVNRVLCVDLDENEQIKRTVARDNTSIEYVSSIIKAQISRNDRRRFSQDIMYNSGRDDAKKRIVCKFHEFYVNEVKKNES